jgi:heme/copper-type cytochrome/quinol oxidase subunit 2
MGKYESLNFRWEIGIGVLCFIVGLFLLIQTSITISFLDNANSVTASNLKITSVLFLIVGIASLVVSIWGLVNVVKYHKIYLEQYIPEVVVQKKAETITTAVNNNNNNNNSFLI